MINGSAKPASARVFICITDPNDYTRKNVVQVTGFNKITSTVTMDGIGTATIAFSNYQDRYFKAVNVTGSQPILEHARKALEWYRSNASRSESIDAVNAILDNRSFHPWFGVQDLIWIDYLGSDGVWYPGFTGIITGWSDVHKPEMHPAFTINAKDFRRVMQYSPVVYGLNNISGTFKFDTLLTKWQEQYLSLATILSTVSVADAFKLILSRLSDLWQVASPPFFANDFWPKEPVERNLAGSESLLRIGLYTDPIANAYYDGIFSGSNTVYQQMMRSKFDFTTVEMESALSILNKIAQATFSYVFCDQLGNLRHEYPRYDTLPSDSPNLDAVDESGLSHHGLNYYIGSSDASFMGYSSSFDESSIAATRVTTVAKQHFLQGVVKPVQDTAYTGIDQASEAEMLKYGLRDMTMSDFYLNTAPNQQVVDAYAKSIRSHLNAQGSTFSLDLNRRPDLQLNRTIVFVDRGRVGLITSMTDSYTPNNGHTRSVTCKFAYYLGSGEVVDYPWRILLREVV